MKVGLDDALRGKKTHGIYDLEKEGWILDCFDGPLLFFDAGNAEQYLSSYKATNPGRYEVRTLTEGT